MISPVPVRNRAWLLTPAAKQRTSNSPSARRLPAQEVSPSAQIGRHRLTMDGRTPGGSTPDERVNPSEEEHQTSSEGRSPEGVLCIRGVGHEDRGFYLIHEGQCKEDLQHRIGSNPSNGADSGSSSSSPTAADKDQSRTPSPKGSLQQQIAESPISGLQIGRPRLCMDLSAASELSKRQWQLEVPTGAGDRTPGQEEDLRKDSSRGNPVWMVQKIIHRPAKPMSTLGPSLLLQCMATHKFGY